MRHGLSAARADKRSEYRSYHIVSSLFLFNFGGLDQNEQLELASGQLAIRKGSGERAPGYRFLSRCTRIFKSAWHSV